MEKPPKTKSKILRFLPRAASAVISFQNLPFSPGRERIGQADRANHHHRFSGPLIPSGSYDDELGLDAPEPTSPKISCMGQIKLKKKKKIEARSDAKRTLPPSGRVKNSKLKRMFSAKLEKKTELSIPSPVRDRSRLPDRAPSLSQAKRFASGRDVLADFDWTEPFTPVDKGHRNYYSDDDERGKTFPESSDGEEGEDKEEVVIPFSAPISVGGLGGVASKPRKEVNLWKRRTMAPPRPLQLHTMVRAN